MPADERLPALSAPAVLDPAEALALLATGTLEVEGRLIEASNVTLLGEVSQPGQVSGGQRSARCVYKPVRGERPLWDFPDGTLAGREMAAFVLSEETGWAIVPPTVLRDGPFGTGMVQWWVDVDERVDLGLLVRSDDPALRRMALFDAVVNNSDRKGGHLLPVAGGHVYGCDHGLTFHREDKLRTVLWGWRGQPLHDDERAVLTGLLAGLSPGSRLKERLEELITSREVAALGRRIGRLLRFGEFPQPSQDWPVVPWPPF